MYSYRPFRSIPFSNEGTSEETAQNFITLQDEQVGHEIGEIFDRTHGRLLVVGLPGAGKTTLLLQLAVELLDRAERAAQLRGVPPIKTTNHRTTVRSPLNSTLSPSINRTMA